MTLQDSFILAWRTVKSNKLRTGITVAIIAFGIMALIGIITAISAMNQSLKENFSFMGANAFSIRYKEMNARMMGGGRNQQEVAMPKGQYQRKAKELKDFEGSVLDLDKLTGVAPDGTEFDLVRQDAPRVASVLLEMKGWRAITNGEENWVTDDIGRKLGSFPTAQEAIRVLENSNRHIRTR
jgi:hypothetical protein